jgi:DnaJ-class molecular chaperone
MMCLNTCFPVSLQIDGIKERANRKLLDMILSPTRECPDCNGLGYGTFTYGMIGAADYQTWEEPCKRCGGTGKLTKGDE